MNLKKFGIFLENVFSTKKDALRPYDQFAPGLAPRSLICVRKRKIMFFHLAAQNGLIRPLSTYRMLGGQHIAKTSIIVEKHLPKATTTTWILGPGGGGFGQVVYRVLSIP